MWDHPRFVSWGFPEYTGHMHTWPWSRLPEAGVDCSTMILLGVPISLSLSLALSLSHYLSLMEQINNFFGEAFFIGHVCSPEKQRETESKKPTTPPPRGGRVTLQSLLLHSPLRILGMHAHAPGVSLSHQVWDLHRGRLHGSPAT